MKRFKSFVEDGAVAANVAGAGNVAGIGIPPGPGKGEPGVPAKNRYKTKNKKDEKAILGGLLRR